MKTVLETSIAPAIRRDIAARLDAVEATHGVRLLMAVESGSRAWGFPSPDSDYDVRFVYVRPRDWYLALQPGRDVIEAPIVDEIDLNGWDVRKALGLLLRSNAVVSEWIGSPIRYRTDDPFVARLAALADALFDARATAHHYANLGNRVAALWLDRADDVPVKRYFYALRPALAIRALRHSPTARPPMDLPSLILAGNVPDPIVERIARLVEAKARTNEKANAARMPELDALIRDELGRVAEIPARAPDPVFAERADHLFLDLVNT